jgi:TRAP-type C4-dicarboxylate transport system permease small subunit
VYLSGVVFSVLAAFILALDLLRLLTGRIAETDLVMVQESEEAVQLQQILGAQAGAQGDARGAGK